MEWFLRFTLVILCPALLGAVINLGFTVGIPPVGFRCQMKRFLVTLLFAFLAGLAGFYVPLFVLFGFALLTAWWTSDWTDSGLSIVMVGLAPITVLTAIAAAVVYVNRWYNPPESKPEFDPGRRRFLMGIFGGGDKGK